MTLVFWILWTIDLLAALLLFWSLGFRGSFGASTDRQVIMLVLLLLVIIGGPLLRLVYQWRTAANLVVALPVFAGLVAYVIDSVQKSPP